MIDDSLYKPIIKPKNIDNSENISKVKKIIRKIYYRKLYRNKIGYKYG